MRVLLDTHIFFWWITNQGQLTPQQWKILADDDQPVFVSAVTAWEIAIKVKLGKWNEAASLLTDLEETIRAEGFDVLDFTIAQAKHAGGLDLVHRDPFDRMLAAQALDLDLVLMTADPALALLGCQVI
jgi:PIN domain nuclease of toxin-antitoxin system